MPAVESPILLDFDRCRVLHGETLVAEMDLVTGTDARLTDARTPTAHATSHVTGGTDVIASAVAAGNAGLMTGADKAKLDGIAEGANLYVHPNHSGDVTSVADGAQTIAADAVTYAKMQNVSAISKLLGRGSAAGVGDPEEITLGTNLSMSGTTLNAAGGGGGNSVTTTLAFGASFTDKAETVVTGQAWVTATSEIVAQVRTPTGTDPDEMRILDFKPVISNLVVGTGFTVSLYSEAEARGNYDVMCVGV